MLGELLVKIESVRNGQRPGDQESGVEKKRNDKPETQ